VQLSLFSAGAANNADFICMAAEGKTFLAVASSFFAAGSSFLSLHPKQIVITVMNKRITLI
jgi:hypothetical protein